MITEKDYSFFINHLKQFGFVFQGSQIYGGLANTWDYGPLGSLLLKNIKDFWLDFFVTTEPNMFLVDTKILLNPQVWKASGHQQNFNDLLVENTVNKKRYRVDHLLEEVFGITNIESWDKEKIEEKLAEITSYDNSKVQWSKVRQFNLMFETFQGVVADQKASIYLRPETAQGIFINFSNILRSQRPKLPFGVAQIGKSFRNEITPGNFIFRTREFEQMEMEVFCYPEQASQVYQKYIEKISLFLKNIGLEDSKVRLRHHDTAELAHYSQATADYEFKFAFGWGELIGISNRSDFDLKTHSEHSGESLTYLDPVTNQKFYPFVVEPSIGADRLMLAVLENAFTYDQNNDRYFLSLQYDLSPYKVAILPLVKKFNDASFEIYQNLLKNKISATFDQSGNIGKRYRIQDAMGTFFCITYDYQSLEDNTVTIRHRDTMEQKRIAIDEIVTYLQGNKGLNGL